METQRRNPVRRARHPAIETLEARTLFSAAALSDAVAYPTFRLAHRAGALPAATSGPTGLTPAQIRHAYGMDAVSFGGVAGDGTGQTIAIIDAYDDPNASSDLHNFDAAFGLSDPPSFSKLNENGGSTLPAADTGDTKPNTWELEESLDIEWAHVMAPAASIILYEANSPSFSDLVQHAENAARNNPGVTAISMSFGGSEFSGESSYDSYFTTPAGHAPVSFFASTGDNGSPGSYPAYSPNVVAVGGTTLSVDSAGNYQRESGWSDSGGGTSTQEAEPAFQNGLQSSGARGTPDVSCDADPNSGVPVYDTYDNGTTKPWIQAGGTSLSSPMWASLASVANQGRARNGLSSLNGGSQLLPMLYQAPSSDFHDITSGSNGGFSAGPGYDFVTGRGSPVANLLVPALAGSPASSSSASFVKADTATRGSWNGVYGADGYSVVGGATAYPAYAQVTASGASTWTWAASTTDVRGLQTSAGSASRVAACDYSSSFTLGVNLTDGKAHQVELYMVDWDSTGRSQTVQVTDAATGAVLDTRSVSNFHGGQWLVWNLSGNVNVTLTCTGGWNAVASGLMFGAGGSVVQQPPPGSSAAFLKSDSATQGSWGGVYGVDGFDLLGLSASLPSYAQVSQNGASTWTWASSTTDVRALQTSAGASTREMVGWYGNSFIINLNFTDGQAHQVALYMCDWDSTQRAQTITVSDAATGAVLDSRSVNNFHNGQWLVWNLSGNVNLTFTCTGGWNAVAQGLMFDPAA